MSDVTNCANIDSGLTRDNFGVEGRDLVNVKVIEGLCSQVLLSYYCLLLKSYNFLLIQSLEDEWGFLWDLRLDYFNHFFY